MVAYLGLQNSEFPRLLQKQKHPTWRLQTGLLRYGATTAQEAQLWAQLSRDLHYILVSVCSGQAAVLCRQHSTQAQGLETWRQLHNRFSIPVGTRSVGYLTKLLKPQFNEQKFEEPFTTWEFEIARYERDNQAPIPDNIKLHYYSTKQKERCNNTYNSEQVQFSVMLMYVSSFLSITEQLQHFPRCKPNNKHSTQGHRLMCKGKRKARPVKVWLRASESPKEQKHVELKYMFIKHLIHDGIPCDTQNQRQAQSSWHTYNVCDKRSATVALVPSGHTPARELRRDTAATVSTW